MHQFLICFIYFLLFNIQSFCLQFFKLFYAFFISSTLFSNRIKFLERIQIKAHSDAQNKIPHHIAFLIVGEDPSYIDLSKLVFWSISFKIYTITLFDPHGMIKNNVDILKHEIKSYVNAIYKCKISPFDICYKILSDTYGKISHQNGFTHNIIIYIADSLDGHKIFNDVCLDYYQKTLETSEKTTITPPEFTLAMNKKYPEPNLAVKYGDVACLAGFMPWHLRFTEIVSQHSHKNILISDFIESLQKYSNCQQNFGT